ncbi:hypothetical protein B0J13DRAFT_556957 [Dactylonectria estremocensis]|uniref:Zn(2)-C6 fungal-type domain-containing protein n=1 Tax=Dactylonectria estremocensis TaxID=1079267 RepID=A0A9P9EPE1_9HYPO|nr:hypothetical protein B0J13DRAFT_556957 [Dactylonectria estremocensis]
MVGVPSSRGCAACRKQKKKCNQEQPVCRRCVRLEIPCIGNGVKRWVFKQENTSTSAKQIVPSLRHSPSNDTTRVVSSLVFFLGIDDIRYGIRALGRDFISDLPRRIGSSQTLDTSVRAILASYKTFQHGGPKVEALAHYGDALAALGTCLQDPKQSFATKIYTVYNINVCQEIVDRKPKFQQKHLEAIAALLQEAHSQGRLAEIKDYLNGLCRLIAWESMINPNVTLGPWFWEALNVSNTPRPITYYKPEIMMTVDIANLAEISMFIRAPKRHLAQIRHLYNFMQSAKPRIRVAADQMRTVAAGSASSADLTRISAAYSVGYGTLLAMAAILNRLLRMFDGDPSLVIESHTLCDEGITLAYNCSTFRPLGTLHIPNILKMMWASTSRAYRCTELEALLADWETDMGGHISVVEAQWIKDRLDELEARQYEYEGNHDPSIHLQRNAGASDPFETTGGCCIL